MLPPFMTPNPKAQSHIYTYLGSGSTKRLRKSIIYKTLIFQSYIFNFWGDTVALSPDVRLRYFWLVESTQQYLINITRLRLRQYILKLPWGSVTITTSQSLSNVQARLVCVYKILPSSHFVCPLLYFLDVP